MGSFDAESHAAPREITAVPGDPERGVIELRAAVFSSSYIRDWRKDEFRVAAETALCASGVTEVDGDEIDDLVMGCSWAANRSCIFEPGEGVIKFSEPVQKLGRLLGPKTFQAIYNAPPPKELIDYIVSGRPAEDFAKFLGIDSTPPLAEVVDLSQITVEVLRGRLDWEERFAEIGVPDPVEYAQTAPSYLHNDGGPMWGSY